MVTYRGVVVEEGGRLNNYAIEPEMYVDSTPRSGFTTYAETLNGRLAMLGFVSLVGVELLTGHGLIAFFRALG